MFTRYMTLSNQPLPRDWRHQYTKAVDFFALLRRPDGTLPLLGDTTPDAEPNAPPVFVGSPPDFGRPLGIRADWKPDRPFGFYPLSGYSIWWNGLPDWPDTRKLSQLLVTWSHFPGHGHPRAQELSVLFWASGQTWWTNTGYWSYSHPARRPAESWQGGGRPMQWVSRHAVSVQRRSRDTVGSAKWAQSISSARRQTACASGDKSSRPRLRFG